METSLKLAQARIEKGLTQSAVAEYVNVAVTTICRWEKGTMRPYPRHVHKLCALFGKTAHELGLVPGEANETPSASLPGEVRLQEDHAFAKWFRRDIELRLDCIMYDWLHSKKYSDPYALLQYRLSQELEVYDSMNEQSPKPTHKGIDLARRDALRRLALLPIYALGLSTLDAAPKWAPEDLLSHCAAGITACQHLAKGQHEDMALAFSVLATYLPPLKKIVEESSLHRKEASRLVGQALRIQSVLSVHREGARRAANYARQAVIYSKESGDLALQLIFLSNLAWIYSCDKQKKAAVETSLQAKYLLESSPLPLPALVQSLIYGSMAKHQAQNRQQEEAFSALHSAHETFALAQEPDGKDNFADYNLSTLILRDGLTHYYLGHYDDAFTSFAQAIDPETLASKLPASSERVRVEIINHQVLALLKSSKRDREQAINLWSAGMQGAIALRSEQRFNESLTAYDIMEALWSDDDHIGELRDLIQHW